MVKIRMNRLGQVMMVMLCVLAGCAGTADRVEIAIPEPSASSAGPAAVTVAQSGNGLRVVVSPFEDARSDRAHLGSRSHLWGGTSYFDLPRGTVGEAVAKVMVQQLNKRGWQATLAGQGGGAGADATISGTIKDLTVTANSKIGHTEIAAKHTMLVRVANHGDQSSIQERVLGSGTDEVFWFNPEDAQQLVNELIDKNIEKFLADTKVEGRTVRLR